MARIYEVFPLICPTCHAPLTFIAFLTDPEPMGPDSGQAEEAAQEPFPVDLDQSPSFDPAEPEPIPQDHFDQSCGA